MRYNVEVEARYRTLPKQENRAQDVVTMTTKLPSVYFPSAQPVDQDNAPQQGKLAFQAIHGFVSTYLSVEKEAKKWDGSRSISPRGTIG